MASLMNLVEIAKRVLGVYPTVDQQLDRLQKKYDSSIGYTPNPLREAEKGKEGETSSDVGEGN